MLNRILTLLFIMLALSGCSNKLFIPEYDIINGTRNHSSYLAGKRITTMNEGNVSVFAKPKGENDYLKTGTIDSLVKVGKYMDAADIDLYKVNRKELYVEKYVYHNGSLRQPYGFRRSKYIMIDPDVAKDPEHKDDTDWIYYSTALKNTGFTPVNNIVFVDALPYTKDVFDISVFWSYAISPGERVENNYYDSSYLKPFSLIEEIFMNKAMNHHMKKNGYDNIVWERKIIDNEMYLIVKIDMKTKPLEPGESIVLWYTAELDLGRIYREK